MICHFAAENDLTSTIVQRKRSASTTENEIDMDKDKAKNEKKRTPGSDSDKPKKNTPPAHVEKESSGAKQKQNQIVFGTSMTANRMRRKFPLVFCSLERDNGIVCPGVQRGHHMEQFYYDAESNRCLHFVYNGCGGNGNRFSSLWECNTSCVKRMYGIGRFV